MKVRQLHLGKSDAHSWLRMLGVLYDSLMVVYETELQRKEGLLRENHQRLGIGMVHGSWLYLQYLFDPLTGQTAYISTILITKPVMLGIIGTAYSFRRDTSGICFGWYMACLARPLTSSMKREKVYDVRLLWPRQNQMHYTLRMYSLGRCICVTWLSA
jgi:hypothetical protein